LAGDGGGDQRAAAFLQQRDGTLGGGSKAIDFGGFSLNGFKDMDCAIL